MVRHGMYRGSWGGVGLDKQYRPLGGKEEEAAAACTLSQRGERNWVESGLVGRQPVRRVREQQDRQTGNE